jgi:structural maintenance of chromosome 4
LGRLGDLGTIAEEYDRAISSGCSYLDYIVVDTVETGEKCLQFLREHKLGRASFICLDRVRQQVERARQ